MYEHFCFTKLFDTFSFSWRQNFVQLRPDINIFMQSTLHVWDRFLSSFFVMSQQKLLMLVTLIQNYPSESLNFFGMIVEKLTRVKNALEVFLEILWFFQNAPRIECHKSLNSGIRCGNPAFKLKNPAFRFYWENWEHFKGITLAPYSKKTIEGEPLINIKVNWFNGLQYFFQRLIRQPNFPKLLVSGW